MSRTLRVSFGLLAVVVVVLALAPKPVAQISPDVPDVAGWSGPGMLVVDLVDDDSRSDDADLLAIEGALGADLDWASVHSRDDGLIVGQVADLSAAMATLRRDPRVENVEPEVMLSAWGDAAADGLAAGFPNDPMYDKQWHLRAMGAPDGWKSTPRGRGVVVAVVDTGVTKVDDLDGTKILEGASFVPGTRSAADDNGHGTHCAGTIAQTTNNGKGVAGVAPEAAILPVKVLSGAGFGSSAWIASGIDYAADNGADVISMSLGGGYSAVIHTAVKRAREKGVIVVAAAGNSGREGVSYPGALKEAIGVSATGPDGSLAPYSSWGKGVDVSAPGGDKTKAGGGVWQDTIDGKGGHKVAEFQGTSMATPHVAGAAAVLLSTGMDADSVERTLLDSSDGTGSWDPKFGWGKLNLHTALTNVIDKFGFLRFGLAASMVLMLTNAATVRPQFRAVAASTAAVVGGGMFFLDWLPLPQNAAFELLSRPFLLWPAVLLDSRWVNFPLWVSALLPTVVALTLGAFKPSRALALGFVVGVGAHLVHGAATGTLNPWWFPGTMEVAWLVGNGVICLILGLALVGAEKLDGQSEAKS